MRKCNIPRKQILKAGSKKVDSTELTYEDLEVLFKQYISKYGKPPRAEQYNGKYNLPCVSRIRTIVSSKGIAYETFLNKFGIKHNLLVNGILKSENEIDYSDLKILYAEYIETHNKIPMSKDCQLINNLPHRKIINVILKKEKITYDDFLLIFDRMSGKRKHPPIHIGDTFGRWKVIATAPPRQVGHTQRTSFWLCECTCGSGIRKEISDNSLQTGNSKSCGCLQIESIQKLKGTYRKQNFEQWCISNNHQDFLDRWDYEKNQKLPSEVSYISHNKYYFKCDVGIHESSLYQLSSIVQMKTMRCKFCDSFAQRFINIRGEDALEKYWDYNKNTDDPWTIPGSSYKKVWLKCLDTDYHGSYEIRRDSAIVGTGCPYCNHNKIHPKDSFAQMLIDRYGEKNFSKMWNKDLNKIDPYRIAPSTRKHKVYLNCLEKDYHPPTLAHPNDIKNHSGYCHYCAKLIVCKEDSLGYLFPQVLDIWSEKNAKTPYDYFPNSNQKVWWKCKNGKHKDFQRMITDAKAGEFGCPECSRESTTSKLQNKVSCYIENKYGYEILHEHLCNLNPRNPMTGSLLYYDNEISELKLIIEVNGLQHYEITGFTYMTAEFYKTSPEEELEKYQYRDKIKKDFAIANGYSYLEIPYWLEKNEEYKEVIDDAIIKATKRIA